MIKNTVNFPKTYMSSMENTCRLTFINDNIAGVLGDVLSILADNKINVLDMMNKNRDEVAYNNMVLETTPSDEMLEFVHNNELLNHLQVI
ncbi:MAG: hypothetical protein GY931_22000 [Maribacter sp.]|nr:hypothetical protein [Maribacter sp.]